MNEPPNAVTDDHVDALLHLATHTRGALSPAQARAALRRVGMSDVDALIDLARGARLLAAQASVLEVEAGSSSRTAEVSPDSLADRLDLSVRTVQTRYRKARVRSEDPKAGLLALVVRDAQGRPRPVVLSLALDTGRFGFDHPQEQEGPRSRIVCWPVPLLTGPGARTLLQALKPRALRVLIGADPDPSTETFTLDEDARAAADEIGRICEEAAMSYPVLQQVEARDHFAGQEPARVASALGLPEGAGPEQVSAAAELVRENALGRLILLTGVENYLQAALTPTEEVVEQGADGEADEGGHAPSQPPSVGDEAMVRRAAQKLLDIHGLALGEANVAHEHQNDVLKRGVLPRSALAHMARARLITSVEERRLTGLAVQALPLATRLLMDETS